MVPSPWRTDARLDQPGTAVNHQLQATLTPDGPVPSHWRNGGPIPLADDRLTGHELIESHEIPDAFYPAALLDQLDEISVHLGPAQLHHPVTLHDDCSDKWLRYGGSKFYQNFTG
ncbi:MAG TPA: hypothetical protein VMW49_00525, partial [Candidatus Dormibacteraeota bacterium]|nr:hypothetical protein [Candidatus Dormibacteraeota bacterium]